MSFTPGAGTRFLLFGSQPLSGGTISGNSSASFLDISGTWNTTGTPTGIRLNVTDTASNAASLLMDLQTGGTSLFRVTKDGLLRLQFGTGTPHTGGSPGIQLLSGASVWGAIFAHNGGTSGGGICLSPYGSLSTFLNVGANQVSIGVSMPFGWAASAGNVQVGLALALFNESGVLAQRLGTAAQTFRIYNTFTDASNYERLSVDWTSNVAYIRPQNAGTGSARLFVPVTGATTVAGLPAAATAGAGARAFVTDATVTTFASIVAGGGANAVPVVSTGTNWIIG